MLLSADTTISWKGLMKMYFAFKSTIFFYLDKKHHSKQQLRKKKRVILSINNNNNNNNNVAQDILVNYFPSYQKLGVIHMSLYTCTYLNNRYYCFLVFLTYIFLSFIYFSIFIEYFKVWHLWRHEQVPTMLHYPFVRIYITRTTPVTKLAVSSHKAVVSTSVPASPIAVQIRPPAHHLHPAKSTNSLDCRQVSAEGKSLQ